MEASKMTIRLVCHTWNVIYLKHSFVSLSLWLFPKTLLSLSRFCARFVTVIFWRCKNFYEKISHKIFWLLLTRPSRARPMPKEWFTTTQQQQQQQQKYFPPPFTAFQKSIVLSVGGCWIASTMELFSRRSWTTGSSQQSNIYGIMPCMCCIKFSGLALTQQLYAWANPAFISYY